MVADLRQLRLGPEIRGNSHDVASSNPSHGQSIHFRMTALGQAWRSTVRSALLNHYTTPRRHVNPHSDSVRKYSVLRSETGSVAFENHATQFPITTSYVRGPRTPPLVNLTLPEYFKTIFEKYGDRPALISMHENVTTRRVYRRPSSPHHDMYHQEHEADYVHWSFREFSHKIDDVAYGLLHHGIRPRDRVAVVLGNCSAYALLQWACVKIGAILVTINPAYKMHEIVRYSKIHLFY